MELKTVIGRAVWVLLAIAAGAGGYVVGSREGHQRMIRVLQVEAAGNLVQKIEALSFLRLDEAPSAIAQIEREVETLTRTISANPDSVEFSLAYAKTYASVVPPSRATEFASTLKGVEVLQPGKCKPALAALVMRGPMRSLDGKTP